MIKDRAHLSRQALNMYLDQELSAGERDRVEAHLARCTACRAELQALQQLFDALEELALEHMPVPDLASGVLDRIHTRRRALNLKWLVPALQGAIALALLAWGWTRLVGYAVAILRALPTEALDRDLVRATGWCLEQWTAVGSRIEAARTTLQNLSVRPPDILGFSAPQLLTLAVTVAVLWLVGNTLLLHRTLGGPNSQLK